MLHRINDIDAKCIKVKPRKMPRITFVYSLPNLSKNFGVAINIYVKRINHNYGL